jgi:hypothetical protein
VVTSDWSAVNLIVVARSATLQPERPLPDESTEAESN